MIEKLLALWSRVRGQPVREASLPLATRNYLAWNRARWRQEWPKEENAVVLVGLFDWKPAIHGYAFAVNHLAQRRAARPAAFFFGLRKGDDVEPLFASFGAKLELSWKEAESFRARATNLAEEIFSGLQTRAEVEQITVEGVVIGDLIYDSYLRYLARATVELRDPLLRDLIRDALLIFFACADYLTRHQVKGVIADHTVYIACGVLVRLAAHRQIPVYLAYYSPEFYLFELECGARGWPLRWPWWRYRELFAALPPEAQEAGRARGRASLEARLSGEVQTAVLRGQSAYEPASAERLLADTSAPKMLVMLHDFCDAVHVFRDLLFSDFHEWIHFLLSRAAETPFEWYVKPHPNLREPGREAMNAINDAMLRELARTYPRVRILPVGASNRQLIEEGVRALFTVYGTAGHEFAYQAVPVVNAGDNPHIAYGFNHHPRTREEYADLIARADQLVLPEVRREVEEYHYMNYFYFPEQHGSRVQLVDPVLVLGPTANQPEFFDHCRAEATPEREAQIAAYFDRLLGGQPA
jgi:hypothetical protein